MSIHKTLAAAASLVRSRNVMTRVERIAELTRQGKFNSKDSSVFGLPKVRVLKPKKRGKKPKKKDDEK